MTTPTQHHAVMADDGTGHWWPARPIESTVPWERWATRRRCRKTLGHCYHPADAMIAWYCCGCGHERDGMPEQRCAHCRAAQP